MARNGSGTFNLPAGNPIAASSVANSTTRNNTFTEIATALTDSVARDGQAPWTGDMPAGDNKLTGLKPATDRTDTASLAVIHKDVPDAIGVAADQVAGT